MENTALALILMVSILLLILLARALTVLLHELGHAIAAIIFTREKVTVYIGSYGDKSKSLRLNAGILDMWLKYNPFSWQRGLCIPSNKKISLNKRIVCTLAGPLVSFMTCIISTYLAFAKDLLEPFPFVLIIVSSSSMLDLISNLTPRNKPIKLFDGPYTYNDGYTVKLLFYYKRFPESYLEAAEMYDRKEFALAGQQLKTLLENKLLDENIFRLAAASYLQAKDYKTAKELIETFISKFTLNSNDYVNIGLIYSKLHLHSEALAYYDSSLNLNPDNQYALNNKGFTLNLTGHYNEALLLFDKAIEVDSSSAYAYNNRGFAKLKLGRAEEGLEDMQDSFKLDSNNAYYFRNMGVYHFDKSEYTEALLLFKKAKEMDPDVYRIDELISEAESKAEN